MSAIEVRTMSYLSSKPDETRFPDLAACVAALPLCEWTGADEIICVSEGETHGRTYSVEEVKRQLGLRPWMACFQGLGNVDAEHGWNWVPGRHILGMSK